MQLYMFISNTDWIWQFLSYFKNLNVITQVTQVNNQGCVRDKKCSQKLIKIKSLVHYIGQIWSQNQRRESRNPKSFWKGNAILVAGSIFEACSYFQLFNQTEFEGRCAVVTSYNPHGSDISLEDTGATSETDKETIFRIYEEILKDVEAQPNKSKTEIRKYWVLVKRENVKSSYS